MTIYWVTEAIPLPITGMIPMVAFPRKYLFIDILIHFIFIDTLLLSDGYP